jgi:hypothetical protein
MERPEGASTKAKYHFEKAVTNQRRRSGDKPSWAEASVEKRVHHLPQ